MDFTLIAISQSVLSCCHCHSRVISHITFMSQVIGSKQPGQSEHPRMADFTLSPFQYSTDTSKSPIPPGSLVHRLIRQTGTSVRREISHYEPASPYQPGVYPCLRPVNMLKTITVKRVITRSQTTSECLKSKFRGGQSKPSTYLQVFEFQSETSLTSAMTHGYEVQIHH